MSDLNTLLLEGTLVDNVLCDPCANNPYARLLISNQIEQNGLVTESVFEIGVRGNIARACYKMLSKGDRIRAVGKLIKINWNEDYEQYIIFGEHIEKQMGKEN